MNHSLDALINVLVEVLIREHLATDSLPNPDLPSPLERVANSNRRLSSLDNERHEPRTFLGL